MPRQDYKTIAVPCTLGAPTPGRYAGCRLCHIELRANATEIEFCCMTGDLQQLITLLDGEEMDGD